MVAAAQRTASHTPWLQIPVYYEWAMRAGYITYAYTCLVLHEFKYLVFVNPVTGHLVPGEQVGCWAGA